MTDDDIIKPWLDDFERKARAMEGDSFGIVGVSKELQVIAALRRLLEDRDKYKAFADQFARMLYERGIIKDVTTEVQGVVVHLPPQEQPR